MKKIVFFLVFMMLSSFNAPANPIMPESLFAEVYFENDDWYLVIDNNLLWSYGIEDFEFIQIFCTDGQLFLKPSFLPDSIHEITILTNDDLLSPVEINRSGDCITSFYDNFELTTLEWNDILPSPVCGPQAGQSLSIIMIPVEDMNYEWWLVKNNNPLINGGSLQTYGAFSGYVYDQNNIPVPDARIDYIEPYYIQVPYNCFDTLFTDNNGYFTIDGLPARNYYISNIIKNNQAYSVNEHISIEPNSVNFKVFTIDYIVGCQDSEINKNFEISIFPNPFRYKTNFIITCKKNQSLINAHIKICDIRGKLITILPVHNLPDINGQIKIKWSKSAGLKAGHYIYSLNQEQDILASGKMTICE